MVVEFEGDREILPKGVQFISVEEEDLNRMTNDLTELVHLNEPVVLYHLGKRFRERQIYTRIGSILVSVNPYQPLPIYGDDSMDRYVAGDISRIETPHIFEVAHRAHITMLQEGRDQSIIVSGDSGAGKTEAAKACLRFLARSSAKSGAVLQKIIQSTPILEAFGNAATVRNFNSSRFGKYCRILFDNTGRIAGARNTSFLLEKTRVVHQSKGERNYHIFYQLLRGTNSRVREWLKLDSIEMFRYLNQSDRTSIPDVDDAKQFKESVLAMKSLRFSSKKVNEMFQILGAILHIGNIEFRQSKDLILKDEASLTTPARLLQVDPEKLKSALIFRKLVIRGETTLVRLSPEEASENRDALAKLLYQRLFDSLITRINACMRAPTEFESKESSLRSVAILDVYGFEIFQNNSFEQVCINYANEKLQQFFNLNVFQTEMELYKLEKIDFEDFVFSDNQATIDLIEKAPTGIFRLLEEACRLPRETDLSLLEHLHNIHRNRTNYSSLPKKKHCFEVKHYAGPVTYDITGFLNKNRDTISADILSCLSESEFGFISTLIKEDVVVDRQATMKRKKAVSARFSSQLTTLMDTLTKTEPQYIRCIKPNDDKHPEIFCEPKVLQQLNYCGVFEAIRIRKLGYPCRMPHEEFYARYRELAPGVKFSGHTTSCQDIARSLGLESLKVGKTQVFFKEVDRMKLEDIRVQKILGRVVKMQALARAHIARKRARILGEARANLHIVVSGDDIAAIKESVSEASRLGLSNIYIDEAKFRIQQLKQQEKEREEARLRAEEEARLRAEEEARLKAEEDSLRAEEEARLKAEEEARLRAEEEARLKAEEEARLRAEEEARLKAEKEARLKAEEEARLKAEEEARLRAEEEARLRAEEEVRLRAEEEARLKAEEEARLRAEENVRLRAEDEARRRAEEEVMRRAEEENRRRAQEEVRLLAVLAEEEARLKAEEEARLRAAEETRLKSEEKDRLCAEAEARRKAEAKKMDLKADVEDRLRAADEVKRKAKRVSRLRAAEEIKRKSKEEAVLREQEEEKDRLGVELEVTRKSALVRHRASEIARIISREQDEKESKQEAGSSDEKFEVVQRKRRKSSRRKTLDESKQILAESKRVSESVVRRRQSDRADYKSRLRTERKTLNQLGQVAEIVNLSQRRSMFIRPSESSSKSLLPRRSLTVRVRNESSDESLSRDRRSLTVGANDESSDESNSRDRRSLTVGASSASIKSHHTWAEIVGIKSKVNTIRAKFLQRSVSQSPVSPRSRSSLGSVNSAARMESLKKKFEQSTFNSSKCTVCGRVVYKMEAVTSEGSMYHRWCFKCQVCNRRLKGGSYRMKDKLPYCPEHTPSPTLQRSKSLRRKTSSKSGSFSGARISQSVTIT
eukprot:836282_1